jgi:hypothetical protein
MLVQAAGVEQQDPLADSGKAERHCKILEAALLGQDCFKQLAQFGDFPLSATGFVDETPLSFLGGTDQQIKRTPRKPCMLSTLAQEAGDGFSAAGLATFFAACTSPAIDISCSD